MYCVARGFLGVSIQWMYDIHAHARVSECVAIDGINIMGLSARSW